MYLYVSWYQNCIRQHFKNEETQLQASLNLKAEGYFHMTEGSILSAVSASFVRENFIVHCWQGLLGLEQMHLPNAKQEQHNNILLQPSFVRHTLTKFHCFNDEAKI